MRLSGEAEAATLRAVGAAKAEAYTLRASSAVGASGYTAMQIATILGEHKVKLVPEIAGRRRRRRCAWRTSWSAACWPNSMRPKDGGVASA